MSDMGTLDYVLGIKVQQFQNGWHLSQAGYIRDILNKYKMTDCKPKDTPMSTDALKQDEDTEDLSSDVPYRSIIGSLTYLTSATRPDIACSVNYLVQFLEKPQVRHWNLLKRVLRYLQRNTNAWLVVPDSGQQNGTLPAMPMPIGRAIERIVDHGLVTSSSLASVASVG